MYEACKVETPYPHQTGRPAGSPLDDRRETWLVTGPDLVAVSDSSGACVYMAVASAHLAETLLYPQSPPSPLTLHLAIASMPTGVTRPSEPPLPGNERPSKRQARNHPLAGRGRLLLPPGFTSTRKTGDNARPAASSVRSTPAPSTAAPSTAPSRAHSPAWTATSSRRDASPSSPTAGAGTSHSDAGRRRAVSSSAWQAQDGLADKGKGRASQVAANTGMSAMVVRLYVHMSD